MFIRSAIIGLVQLLSWNTLFSFLASVQIAWTLFFAM